MTAYIGLGSNMGDREGNIREAVRLLGLSAGVRVVKVSSLYETKPVGYEEQADFINAAVCVEAELSPAGLLGVCRGIEERLGRVRTTRWGPRTVDLDILLMGNMVINTKELKVPHPLMHARGFVLTPLAEIAPDAVHPVLRKTVGELLAGLG